MKKRLRKKKAKQLARKLRQSLQWVAGSNPVMMGQSMGDVIRRIDARKAQEISDAALERLFLEGQARLIQAFGQNAVERVYRGLC